MRGRGRHDDHAAASLPASWARRRPPGSVRVAVVGVGVVPVAVGAGIVGVFVHVGHVRAHDGRHVVVPGRAVVTVRPAATVDAAPVVDAALPAGVVI